MKADLAGKNMAVLQTVQAGTVAVLILDNRPVNALSADLRAALAQALAAAAENPAVWAVVIASDTAQFSAGADMAELGQQSGPVNLSALCSLIENLAKPVVVAINGNAVGGGLELALAAHARVAAAGAQMGLPEVNLGILPGAGGTQRLPRLVGAGPALRIMLESKPTAAAEALAIGLVDVVVETGLRDAAIAHAAELADKPLRRTADRAEGFRDPVAYRTAVSAWRKKLGAARAAAALRIIDCVEAAQLLPMEQGLAFEAAAFDDLVHSPDARGLRHAFMVERRAMFPPADLATAALPALSGLAVWGGGARAGDVIVQALGAGLHVNLIDPRREVMVATLQHIAARQEAAVADGRLTAAARDADWARLRQSPDPDNLYAASRDPEDPDSASLASFDLTVIAPDAPPLPHQRGALATIILGPLVARAPAAAVALVPAQAAGLAAELCAGPDAPVGLRALALAFGRRLGWKVLFSGPGGPIERQLRAAITAAIAALETAGFDRTAIAESLAANGVGISETAALPPMPQQADTVMTGCLAALANAGARMISEGVARRPADVDTVAVLAGILPRRMGGPMFWADARGLIVVRADLRTRAGAAPQIYAPDPLFDLLIRDGMDFAKLNRK